MSAAHNHTWCQRHCISISDCSCPFQFLVCLDISGVSMGFRSWVQVVRCYGFEFLWYRPRMVGPCSHSFSWRALSSGVYRLVKVLGMPWIFCLPSDTRWCNTSKDIYIISRCWSQTPYYGAVRCVQSVVNFA